jgi:hypothetical protein
MHAKALNICFQCILALVRAGTPPERWLAGHRTLLWHISTRRTRQHPTKSVTNNSFNFFSNSDEGMQCARSQEKLHLDNISPRRMKLALHLQLQNACQAAAHDELAHERRRFRYWSLHSKHVLTTQNIALASTKNVLIKSPPCTADDFSVSVLAQAGNP